MHLDHYYISIKVLLTFLIALILYDRHCPQLVKAKVLGPHPHHRFLAHYQECPLTLMILAWTHFKKTYLYLQLQVQPSSPGHSLPKKTCVKKNHSLVVYTVFRQQYFERSRKYYNILGKNCLPLVCTYYGKHKYRLFYNRHCDVTIVPYSSRSSIRKFLKQRTKMSIFGIMHPLVARQSIELLATTQFRTINSFSFAMSQRLSAHISL